MDDNESRKPTDGETDGNDAELYGQALGQVRRGLASSRTEMAYLARASVDQLRGLVDAAAEALVLLIGGVQTLETESCTDGLTEQLGAAAEEAIKRAGQFRPLMQQAHELLSTLDTAEARACREALQKYLPDSKRDAV